MELSHPQSGSFARDGRGAIWFSSTASKEPDIAGNVWELRSTIEGHGADFGTNFNAKLEVGQDHRDDDFTRGRPTLVRRQGHG